MLYRELSLPPLPRSGWLRVWHVRTEGAVPPPRAEMQLVLQDLLAEVAGEHTGIDPARIKVVRDGAGRPMLTGVHAGLVCSYSYRAGSALAALGGGLRLGVDCECLPPDFDWRAVAEEFFNTGEIALLASYRKEAEVRQNFARFWTRKEALAKAAGQGVRAIDHGLPLSEAARRPGLIATWVEGWASRPGHWLMDLDLPEPVVGSVAWA